MKLMWILAIVIIASASANEEICDKAFFLLIKEGGIEELRSKVGNVSEEYMSNYSYVCKDFRQLFVFVAYPDLVGII